MSFIFIQERMVDTEIQRSLIIFIWKKWQHFFGLNVLFSVSSSYDSKFNIIEYRSLMFIQGRMANTTLETVSSMHKYLYLKPTRNI